MAKRKSREVLSIRQPWAELVLSGDKWCENRTWKTDYRGRLYIHASRCDSLPTEDWKFYNLSRENMTTGVIVGHVELVDVARMGEDTSDNWSKVFDHVAQHHRKLPTKSRNLAHLEGPYCWIFKNPQRLRKAIPAEEGKLRLWKFHL